MHLFYISQAMPEIYNYWIDLWAEVSVAHHTYFWDDEIEEDDQFNEEETFVSPDE